MARASGKNSTYLYNNVELLEELYCGKLTEWCESQLPTDYGCISISPEVVTDCSVSTIIADFNSPLRCHGSANQTEASLITSL